MTSCATDSELSELCRRIVCEVPGITFTRVDRTAVNGPGGQLGVPNLMGVRITVSGWSPTLHERRRTYTVPISDQPNGPDSPYVELTGRLLGTRIRAALSGPLKAQRALAATASRNGIGHPRGLPDARAGRLTIGHIHTSRALLDLMVRDAGETATVNALATRVAELHSSGYEEDEAGLLDFNGDRAHIHADRPTLLLEHKLRGNDIVLRGGLLVIWDTLPDTIITALPGRPLRTVLETGIDHLDDTPILGTHHDDQGRLVVRMDVQMVRIADHVPGPFRGLFRGPFASSSSLGEEDVTGERM